MTNQLLRLALDEFDKPAESGKSALLIMKEKRNLFKAALDDVLIAPSTEKRNLRQSETRDFDLAKERIEKIDERITELEADSMREAGASETRRLLGTPGVQSGNFGWSVNEPGIYQDPAKYPTGPSFFRDLFQARMNADWDAADRLKRSQVDRPQVERRALGNSGAVGGSGGELAPPAWLEDAVVEIARPGRVFADLATRMPLPQGVSSVNIPKVLTGSVTGVQTSQNTALPDVDPTTGSLTANIVTIGGKVVTSQQLLDQGHNVDRILLGDLASDYAQRLGLQFIAGTGAGVTPTSGLRGVLSGAGLVTTAFTTGSPAVSSTTSANSFLNRVIAAKIAVATTRFLPANALVMHPRRWGWIEEALDGNGRPLLSPADAPNGQPQPGTDDRNVAAGSVGTFGGLPVYLDPSIPTTYNSTTQDVAIVCRVEDLYYWESPQQADILREPYGDSMGVLFRLYAYSAAIPDRYPASVNVITGTGMVAPTL